MKETEKKISEARFRPIELVHDFKFIPCVFDQNAPLPSPKERIDRIKALGYGGIALNPDFDDYLSEESVEKTREYIEYAHAQGLTVWIYDEKYYPSGSAGGSIPREHPEFEARSVMAVVRDTDCFGMISIPSPKGCGDAIAAFICNLKEDMTPDFDTLKDVTDKRTFGGGILIDCKGNERKRAFAFFGRTSFEFCCTSHNTRGIRRYTDTLNPDAVKAFLHKTFFGYKDILSKEKGIVESVFTDEPQNGGLRRISHIKDYRSTVLSKQTDVFKVYDLPEEDMEPDAYIPWTEKLPKVFEEKRGYDIISHLPYLFFDEGEKGRTVRADYWETVSDMFFTAYGENYSSYCKDLGIAYSGHFLHEEELWKHPYMHGDIIKQLGAMDIPGCDLLCATPERILASSIAVKYASSAAFLYGRKDCMAEVSNMARDILPITEEAYKLATATEAALGITRFLSYYTDTCLDEDALKRCCDYTCRILSFLDGMIPQRHCYVYIPNKTIMSESYPATDIKKRKTLTAKAQETYDFITSVSEKLIRSRIDHILINDECLDAFARGEYPKGFDKARAVLVLPPNVSVDKRLTESFTVITPKDTDDLTDTLIKMGYESFSSPAFVHRSGDIAALHKTSESEEAYLLVNTGEDLNEKIVIRPEHINDVKAFQVYDPHGDTYTDLSVTRNKDTVTFTLHIPSREARIIKIKAD